MSRAAATPELRSEAPALTVTPQMLSGVEDHRQCPISLRQGKEGGGGRGQCVQGSWSLGIPNRHTHAHAHARTL